jgi:beta-glucosidase
MDDFVWGIATSAAQIEGIAGRGTSIWDTFSRLPGVIADSSNADVACDHVQYWADDLALLAELGVAAYRFSVAWPRVEPSADAINTAGLDFYDRLVDGLVGQGITPVVNLFHWDLPQWVQDAGGWPDRSTADRYASYASVVAARLGDRVGTWATMNEPFEHFVLGHVTGEHAPGLNLPLDQAFAVAHHLLLAHGLGVQALRAANAERVMLINSYAPARPAGPAEADVNAAGLYDLLQNRLFTDPVLLGGYPDELAPLLPVQDGDLDVIAAPIDALGVNYYSINAVRAVDGPVPLEVIAPEGYPITAFGWAVAPEGLTEALVGLRDRYGPRLPPLTVTENGCAYDDQLLDDACDDPDRIAYLDTHIDAVRAARTAGVDVRGYHVWSLYDNFEWAQGYTKRFGLAYLDYPTQRRIPKASFAWYRDAITRGLP